MKQMNDELENMQQDLEVVRREHNVNLVNNQSQKKELQNAINAFRRQSHSEQQKHKPVSHNPSNQSDNHSNRSNHQSNRSEIQTLIDEGRPPHDAGRVIKDRNGYTVVYPSGTYSINNIDYIWGGTPERQYWMYRAKGEPYWEEYDKIKVQKLERIVHANGVKSKRDDNGNWVHTVMATPYHVPLDLTA